MIPVYVINAFPERKAKIAAELARVGLGDELFGVEYVHAAEPVQGFTCNNMRRNPRGEFGCAMSHLKAITTALASKTRYGLFIEDDIEFTGNIGDVMSYHSDWDILYLGGHPRGPVEPHATRKGWYRVRGGFSCAEAYVMHKQAMAAFLQFWCDRAGQPNAMFDFILGDFATQANGYAVYPAITRQPPGWSHIGQKHDDKRDLIERGWKSNLPA